MVRRRLLAVLLASCLMPVAAGVTTTGAEGRARRLPDLVARAAGPLAPEVRTGSDLDAVVDVRNRGRARAGASSLGLFLSKDQRRDGRDVRIASVAIGRLAPGAQETRTVRARVPASAGTGKRWVLMCADATRRVAESAETNNCVVSPASVRLRAPSSEDLIDTAVRRGEITESEAVVLRVYAATGDDRLPTRLTGDDRGVDETWALAEASQAFATLGEAERNLVGPFLVPPAYEGSWLRGASSTAARSTRSASDPAPPCGPAVDALGSVASANGKVRIWYELARADEGTAGDDDLAARLAAAVDSTIWNELTQLFPTPPSDAGSLLGCRGGDDRIDVYLEDVQRSHTLPYPGAGCEQAPAWVVMARSRAESELAHELTHVMQLASDVQGTCVVSPDYLWLAEATAEWTEHHVYPTRQTEHPLARDWFLPYSEVPLDYDEGESQHKYGAYLYFFNLTRELPASVVGDVWAATADGSGVEAVDSGTASTGGFAEHWPDFVAHNWNRKPVDWYRTNDALTAAATPDVDVQMGQGEGRADAVDVDHLAASYRRLTFSDAVRRVTVRNPLPDLGDPAGSLTALVRVEGEPPRIEDWTNRSKVTWCRDRAEEKVTEIVLMVGNSSFGPDAHRLRPAGELEIDTDGRCASGGTLTGTATIEVWSNGSSPDGSYNNRQNMISIDVSFSGNDTDGYHDAGSTFQASGSHVNFINHASCPTSYETSWSGGGSFEDPAFFNAWIPPADPPPEIELWGAADVPGHYEVVYHNPDCQGVPSEGDTEVSTALENDACLVFTLSEPDSDTYELFYENITSGGNVGIRCTGTLTLHREP